MDLYEIVSSLFGWIYFASWSMSFYPQVVRNHRRKRVTGLSLDYVALNFTGFLCYTIFNLFMFVRRDPSVQLNDLLFSLHASFMTSVVILQIALYREKGAALKVSPFVVILIVTTTYVLLLTTIVIAFRRSTFDVLLYMLSVVKIFMTLVKYVPQAVMNHRLKSTVAWSVHNNTLDLVGGVFSVSQSVLDSVVQHDPTIITHNPIKIALGIISMLFDVVFFVQHHLYKDVEDERLPLIASEF
jgi:cystinosin